MQIKKVLKVAVLASKLHFLQYTYRFGINHKTLYSQTFPGPHFGSWTNALYWACNNLYMRVLKLINESKRAVVIRTKIANGLCDLYTTGSDYTTSNIAIL